MKRYFPLALLAALALAACTGQKDDAAKTGATSDKAEASTSDADLLKQAAEVANGGGQSAATPADPNAPAPAADAPAADAGAIPGLTLGKDYEIIEGGQPFEPLNGKVEVVEVFNFVCPACNHFQPMLLPWKKKLPADVRFTYVPAAFGGNWDPYVRAFYAAQMMGIEEKSHEAIYDAIHLKEQLKGERGSDSDDEIGKVYAQFGVDAKQFAANMQSFAVVAKFNRAKQYIMDQKVSSTPTVMVNGKYRVKGASFEDMPRIAGVLVDYERARAGAGAAPAAAKKP